MPNFPLLHNKFRITGIITIAVTVMVYLCFEVTNEWKLNIPVIAYEEPFGPKNYFSVVSVPVYDTIICICLLLGLLFVAFAKLKKEDEYVVSIRLSSWLWAVWINSILLLASFIFFYGISFFAVVVLNFYCLLLIFSARFYWILYKTSKIQNA